MRSKTNEVKQSETKRSEAKRREHETKRSEAKEEAKQSETKRSEKRTTAKRRETKQSKAKWSKAKRSEKRKTKRSKAKQSEATVNRKTSGTIFVYEVIQLRISVSGCFRCFNRRNRAITASTLEIKTVSVHGVHQRWKSKLLRCTACISAGNQNCFGAWRASALEIKTVTHPTSTRSRKAK